MYGGCGREVRHRPVESEDADSSSVGRPKFMPFSDPNRQREYQAQLVARRKAEWFSTKTCVDCGSTEDLELDHDDPEIKISHRVWTWAKTRREQELAKCKPRCVKCHKIKTAKEKWRPITHGTNSSYTQRECRCDACCKAHTLDKKEWRERARKEGRVAS